MPQHVHDLGDVDVVGAAGAAGRTRQTQPQRTVLQGFILEAHLHGVHDLADLTVIDLSAGAARRALAALIASRQILTALFFDLTLELQVPGFIKPSDVHRDSP